MNLRLSFKFLLLSLSCITFFPICTAFSHSSSNLILDVTNRPTVALTQLLDCLSICHDGSLESIINQTQKHWLRSPGKERWEGNDIHTDHSQSILFYAQQMGLVNEMLPLQSYYKYALVFSYGTQGMFERISYLIKLWHNNIRFEKIIFLTSDRLLDPVSENVSSIINPHNKTLRFKSDWHTLDIPSLKTEDDMIKTIYDLAEMPDDLRKIPTIYIYSLSRTQNGQIRRATTADQVLDWLASDLTRGDCLFISHQPFVTYQDSVLKSYMPETFGTLHTCGPALNRAIPNLNFTILDTLARILYQEKIRRK